jgi:beta-galactosidase/beta-glucuronidase
LNGEPYFFNGLLDQGYLHDGIFTPRTPLEYLTDIKRAKALGFNMLRKHIKIEPLVFYYLCDVMGIAVFQDMVNNGSYSFVFDTALPTVGFKRAFSDLRNRDKEARKIFIECAEQTQKLLYNSPSVCLYTIFNEGWGQFRPDEAYARLKSADPTRLYDSTSGWFHGRMSDVDSRHIYFKRVKIKHPDGKPYFLSEFGGYALPLEGHTYGDGKYGYAFTKDKDELFERRKELYLEQLLPLIKDGLSALVYTQLTDVEDETNGFITYDREIVKVDEAEMAEINEKLYEEFNFRTKE